MSRRRWLLVAGLAAVALIAGFAAWWLLRDNAGSSAPSNVRIVQSDVTGEQWIRWDDNSGDEAGFRGSVRLLNDAGDVITISDFNTPQDGAAQTPVTPFNPNDAGDGCYDAIVRVEAVTKDGAIVPADDAKINVCIENGFTRYTPFHYVPEALTFPQPDPGGAYARVNRDHIGNYTLVFESPSSQPERLLTTTRVYTEDGVLLHERDIEPVAGDAPPIAIDAAEGLPAVLVELGESNDSCYRRDFVTWTIEDGALGGWSTMSRLPVCYGEVESFFPTIDNPAPVIPASTSNVGIVRDSGGNWTITWDDNSNNETAFELLVSVAAEGSGDFVTQKGITAGPDRTTAGFPAEALSLPDGCYRVTIYIFSERFDSANGIPGNVTLRMCVTGSNVNFAPTTG